MRITEVLVRAYVMPLDRELTDAYRTVMSREVLTVEMRTSDGITGLSFLTGWSLPGSAQDGQEVVILKTIIDRVLAPLYVGSDPLERERLWERAHRQTLRYGGRGAPIVALSALDMAVWDIAGREAQRPVAQLLGGFATRVPAYVTCGFLDQSLEEVAEEVSGLVDQGFRHIKVKVGSPDVRDDLPRLEAAVTAAAPRARILVDANEAWSVSQAAEFMWLTRDFGLFWVEEPLPTHNVNGYRQLKALSHTALALGDYQSDPFAMRDYLSESILDFTHTDVTRIGGITPWVKLAHAAELWGVRCAAHAVEEVHIHTVAGVPNGALVEHFEPDHRAQWAVERILANNSELKQITDGMMTVPDVHGLGYIFDLDGAREFEIG